MGWDVTGDVTEFLAHCGAFMRADPVRHTVLLSVAELVRNHGADVFGASRPTFGWWRPGTGEVAGAFIWTRPRGPALGPLPAEAAVELATVLRDAPGVVGDPETVAAFTGAWTAATGGAAVVHMRERLYRLDRLIPPDPVPAGRPRRAGPADADTVIAWAEEFAIEAHTQLDSGRPGERDDATRRRTIGRVSDGAYDLWELDGEPVAMSGRTDVVAEMGRIGPVYTPPANRCRGFGAAVTAAATRSAVADGARDVVLFTDLANPISNGIYQRIGYRPVGDYVQMAFGDH